MGSYSFKPAWKARRIPIAALFVVLASTAMALSGCAKSPTNPNDAHAAPSGDADWRLQFEVSGGFTGESDSMSLSGSSGALVYVNVARGSQVSRVLDRETLASLSSAIQAVPSIGHSARNEECRDCFEYTLTILRGGETVRFETDSASRSGDAIEELIRRLLALRQQIQ